MKDLHPPKNGLKGKIRAKLEEIFLKSVRLYTYHTPIARGKHRLYLLASKLCRYPPTALPTKVKDGRKISVNLTTGMHTTVFFLGEFEKVLTQTVTLLVKKGDVCFDIGANFGWYTTLFRQNCGAGGFVHAFEPVPRTFRELELNYQLMGKPENVFINNLAVGDRNEDIFINLFKNLPTGHASISRQGREDVISFQCRMTTLDSYLEKQNVGQINFVKVDIEGAELLFLKGAENLFRQEIPPILLMEMALQQTANFGYKPNDLLQFISARAEYDFYAADEVNGKLRKIEAFAPGDIGANVFCFPKKFYQDRLSALLKQN